MPTSPRLLLLALFALPILACDEPSSSGTVASSAPAKVETLTASAAPPPSAAPPAPDTAAAQAHPTAAPAVDVPAPPDVAAAPADAKKTASGVAFKVLTPGKGKAHPKQDELVKLSYTGWNQAGKMIDSGGAEGKPAPMRLADVMKGWADVLPQMVAGEKRRLWIPSKVAFGDHPMPGAPTGDLVYDLELVDIAPAPKPPPVPTDVKAPPTTATKTDSGLAYRLLQKGTGAQPPKPTDTVIVNYTGWTTNGKMFDSSVPTGAPASLPLNHVIKGWAEGLQLMKVGDVMRFWIPANLAYGDKPAPGNPAGMLVFDIELVGIR